MSKVFWLDDAAWSVVEPLLPRNQPGPRRSDDRRIISGIVHVLRSGCPLRGLLAAPAPRIGSTVS